MPCGSVFKCSHWGVKTTVNNYSLFQVVIVGLGVKVSLGQEVRSKITVGPGVKVMGWVGGVGRWGAEAEVGPEVLEISACVAIFRFLR